MTKWSCVILHREDAEANCILIWSNEMEYHVCIIDTGYVKNTFSVIK